MRRGNADSAGIMGNIAHLANLLSAHGGDWVMFKADRKAAYKRLPLEADDQAAAIAALRRPSGNRWYGFATRALIFGSVAAVIHYNVISRILTALVNRYLGIPPAGYIDDFASIAPVAMGRAAMYDFARLSRAMAFELNDQKSALLNEVAFLALLGASPSTRGGCQMRTSFSDENALSGHDRFRPTRRKAWPPSDSWESWSGACRSRKHPSSGVSPERNSARCIVNSIAEFTPSELSSRERMILSRRSLTIGEFAHRLERQRPTRPVWNIYTDAASAPAKVFAALFRGAAPLLNCTRVARPY